MRELLTQHWLVYAIIAVGLILVVVAGLAFEGAILWVGGIVGVLVGIAIASLNKDRDE
ncbi:MAG: hypothetical protein ACM3S1_01385 [Hyphomicrobiales bacterium]